MGPQGVNVGPCGFFRSLCRHGPWGRGRLDKRSSSDVLDTPVAAVAMPLAAYPPEKAKPSLVAGPWLDVSSPMLSAKG